jgi:hypothetical protein
MRGFVMWRGERGSTTALGDREQPPGSTEAAGGGRRAWLLATALFLAAVAPYLRGVGHEYVALDDAGYVGNRWVSAGISREGLVWAFTRAHSCNWHPLTWLSHMLDVELFGPGPAGPHLVNALLHGGATVLLFLFLRASSGALGASALVALSFAVHPLRVESVAWVAERKDVLSGALFFATLLLYVRYVRRRTAGSYALVLLAYACALLAKPMVVTLPCVLLLVDLWPLGRWRADASAPRTLGRLALEKLPLLGLSVASSALTVWAQSSCGAVSDLGALPFGVRLSNALESTVLYVVKSVWPTGLCIPYPHPALDGLDVAWRPATWGAAALLALATLGALLAARSRPWWTVGWLWFVGMLAPVIGIVQVGAQSMADRYAYLPQLGLLLALVFGLRQAFPSERARRLLAGAGIAAAAVLSVLTVRQVSFWKDTFTLLEHTLEVTGENPVAHANLGIAYLERGDYPRAVQHLRARLASKPSASMLVNLGVALARQGDERAAIECFREALRLSPRLFDAHANLGSLLLARGEAREALEHLEEAARQRPGSKPVQEGLAAAREALGGG